MVKPFIIEHKKVKNLTQKSFTGMMGKSRKFPMGNPGKLMPNFRHAVETMAESEGFGSSGRVDMEMTLSEDSCSPKRKRISLNGDSRDRFGVPVQVLSLSKMSRAERKELEVRLKRELEEVRILQRRVASLVTSSMVVSPTSDIRSCSDGQRRPLLEYTARVPERVPQGKKRLSPGRNGPRLNKGSVEPPRQAAHANSFSPYVLKQCSDLLNQMYNHKLGWVFKEPVDVVKLNIPDYFNVIKHPMDFTTIKTKLARCEYETPPDFAADVRLTFSNAMTYNPPKNDVHIMAHAMSKFFEQRWKAIEKKMAMKKDVPRSTPKMDVPAQNKFAVDHIPPSKKKKVAPVGYVGKPEPLKRVMTNEEKHKLSMELEALLADLPERIIDFLKENSSGAGQTAEDEIEIDIDALGDDVLFKLRKLLDDFLVEKKKQQIRAEPCEMELSNESGFSNSTIQPGKVNDAADEDIDIGGNDHSISSFPPVEIEKDKTPKNDRDNNHSSSSSGSGSSSSDSDSDNSSSELEGGRAVPPCDKLQGTLDAKSNVDQPHNNIPQEVGRDQTGNSLSQVEHTSPTKPPSVEVDCNKEGEIAASERQVSPDKLYRAALLRSRFADTILKAQEKTLEKGEKRDPERLRLEREELERRQREEKARLQAEAKAAEEARRKAEAEAAVEAKKKRELEREAARLALQKMEKTVDINENCQIMADLKLLSSAPADNISNLIGNASPADSPEGGGLGSFRFRGTSNPLEQLGLYRKDDDEEDEEVEPPHCPPNFTLNDVEEGD
ncbi:hypothetical protein RND81_06G065400 [Saponaria officinalis]|uniref:Uncharacterized protein n=1 Tax=Saponaria officinalis TaxID=3572 RepID=A0AAW1K883_SAPOF